MTNQDEKNEMNEKIIKGFIGLIPDDLGNLEEQINNALNKARQQERKRIIDSETIFLICNKCGFKGYVKLGDISIHKNGHCYFI